MVALIGLFVAGQMIGPTPDYLGKRLTPLEMKFVMLYTLVAPVAILLPAALAVVTDWGKARLSTNNTFHGFSEILFACTSSQANNGQNFAGLSANTPFYNVSTVFAMMLGRDGLAILALGAFRPTTHLIYQCSNFANPRLFVWETAGRDSGDRSWSNFLACSGVRTNRRTLYNGERLRIQLSRALRWVSSH